MSEPILIALVQLFAMVAASRHQKISENTRLIIETYLKQYLNSKELEEYLLLYDELFSFHSIGDTSDQKESSNTLNKMMKFCDGIGKGLQQKDKIIVFIKFIEFIEEINKTSGEGSIEQKDYEVEFYRIIRASFKISDDEYRYLFGFLLNPFNSSIDDADLLIVGSETYLQDKKNKKIIREKLEGSILILHLKSVDLLIGRYLGTDDLYLNGHYMLPNQSFILNSGAILKNQKIAPIYYTDIVAGIVNLHQHVHLQFTAQNISFSFKNSRNGIQPFSFTAESGELIGVMGASGAGKSTLLSLLNGTLGLQQGNISINGHDLELENENLKRIIGYIPQDDLLIEELTVFQNLYFNARLCYSGYSPFKLTRTILEALNNVDLSGIRDLVVGNPLNKVISGGQRKRLNIALELIREPFVLFADEPTSGLSSMDSEMVMLLLKEQTLKGRLVMVNIHQPSSNIFKLFDKLLILDKGGFPIYYGNPIDSITYFKSASNYVNPTESECLSCGYVNPEQLFQITEAKTISKHGKVTNQRSSLPEDWYQLFKKNIQPQLQPIVQKNELPENNFRIPNKLQQFSIFSLRNLLIKITNRQYILLNLLEAPFLAFILAYLTRYSVDQPYVFGQNKNIIAYLFMSVVVALFLGMMVSAEEIIRDRKILKREAFLRLSRFSYLNSKVLFLFGLSAIQTLFFVLVGNLILGIHGMMFSYWIILFSTSCFANLVGLNISSGLNSVVNIYILIPFFLVPQILLSGVIVPFDTLNKTISQSESVPVVGDLMASRWAFESLAVEQFKNNEFTKPFYSYDKELSDDSYVMGYLIPAIKSKVDECHRNLLLNRNPALTDDELTLVKGEIQKLEVEAGFKPAVCNRFLTLESLNDSTRRQTQDYLDSLQNYYSAHHKLVFARRDKVYQDLAQTMGTDG
ncbi:MAG: ATP-binding cassette domain-containing protein, partial [Salinivirgaceae bacterium]